ncbi:MAG: TonB-dependent receptor [Paludibacteraceae bacterium]|nr:TonB-dependent receptor [Paludibacteraceae bacterium]
MSKVWRWIGWLLVSWMAMEAQAAVLEGHLYDAETQEPLAGAYVYLMELRSGAVTDADGYYCIQVAKGSYTLQLTYVGYDSQSSPLVVDRDHLPLDFRLHASDEMLDEVLVQSISDRRRLDQANIGTEKFSMGEIRKVPAFMGEVDVIKAVQLLPGVQATSEGSSSFSVRGGAPDQNLILLDGAPVYNASHMMGFFSVFNNDVVEDALLYKGDVPATQGGRLSSLMEVTTSDALPDKFTGRGGIGLISSRLKLATPIVKERLGFWAAGRVFYAGMFLPLSRREGVRNARMTFYDVNAKLEARLSDKHRISLSGYAGQDYFALKTLGSFDYANRTATLRYTAVVNPRLTINTALTGSWYDYTVQGEISSLTGSWQADIADYGLRHEYAWQVDTHNMLKMGVSTSFKLIDGGHAEMIYDEQADPLAIDIPRERCMESALFVQNDQHYGRWTLQYGLRFSWFNNIGPQEELLLTDGRVTGKKSYGKGDFYHTYWNFEPRLSAAWQFRHDMSLKAGYSRTTQYLHLVQTSSAGTPMDIWRAANTNLRPAVCDQLSAGWMWDFHQDTYQLSVELFYKWLQNQCDFKDFASVFLNEEVDAEFLQGRGRSFGAELMLRKDIGRLTGWVSYTFCRSLRTIEGINQGREYKSASDRPHNISLVLNYDFGWIDLGATWVYATGQPLSAPDTRLYFADFGYPAVIPMYSGRNQYRMPDYHRMDLSVTFHLNKGVKKRYDHDLNISLYNVYCRHNAWMVRFNSDPKTGQQSAEKTYLFSIVPSVTYNFYF